MTCAFTDDHYCEIMMAFLKEGYRFVGYKDFVLREARQVILRHDVELSLDNAVRIARIESDMGITSEFHFLLTSEIYNMSSPSGRSAITEISSLGHRTGLHVDFSTDVVASLSSGETSTHWVTTTNFIAIYVRSQGLGLCLARAASG